MTLGKINFHLFALAGLCAVVFLSGCKVFRVNTAQAPILEKQMVEENKDAAMQTGEVTEEADNADTTSLETSDEKNVEKVTNTEAEAEQTAGVSFSGTRLGGSDASPVIDFNKADYDKALAAKKNIVLYFYAIWCPLCKAEIPQFYEAISTFDKDNHNLIAFRVNFNDSDTDADEKSLAREFGVAYQHTKVFLKDGRRILKSPETWTADRYIEEVEKAF